MAYYMLGHEIPDSVSVDAVNQLIGSMLLLTYSPHLWNSSITYLLLGWVKTLMLRELANLPKDVALKILRSVIEQALTILEGD